MRIWTYIVGLALVAGAFVFGVSRDNSVTAARVFSGVPWTYKIDASRSKFMVRAHRGGLAWFKGHDHFIAVRDFDGEAFPSLDALNAASLTMTIRADSLEETDPKFTPEQKAIIKKELNEIVLESAKYPTITFKSTEVTGKMKEGGFEVKIGGDITLHGVTKHIVIPVTVTVNGDTMNAKGEFELDRSDFKVKATSAFHGMVRVRDKLAFTFDINARRL
jgi:polyisoprenoid-binding protein YceI